MPAVQVGELADALEAGFRQDTAEKVYRLLALLREWEETSEGRGKLTLKGGTALNIFHLPNHPRLSVDIDLMATGFPDAAPGTPQREEVVRSLADLARRLDYRAVQRGDAAGAGVGLVTRYENSSGPEDVIKIDLDLLNRQTLLPSVRVRGPELFGARDFTFPIVDRAELLGQKLIAVVYRQTARDPFDMYQMILHRWHALPRARDMYLAYRSCRIPSGRSWTTRPSSTRGSSDGLLRKKHSRTFCDPGRSPRASRPFARPPNGRWAVTDLPSRGPPTGRNPFAGNS